MAGVGEITKGVHKMDLKIAGTSLDTEGNLRLLQQLYQRFNCLTCREPTCRAPLSVGGAEYHIKAWIPLARGSQPTPISAALCTKCRRYTCIGCRRKPALGSKSVTVHNEPEIKVNNCCEGGRLFGIWILLSAFDEADLSVQKQATQKAPKSSGPPSAGKGTGYTSRSGMGLRPFQRSMWDQYSALDLSFQQQAGNDGKEDKPMTDILKILPPFLPSSSSKPAPELFAMFRLSLLIDRLAELVRNDSVTDMTKRKDLYHAAFAFLTAVAKHPALMILLLEQRPTKKGSPGLQALGEEANRRVLKVDASSAGLNLSLLACGQKTSQHAKAFAGLTDNGIIKQNAQSGDTKEAIDLCRALFRFTSAARETAPAAYEALILVPKDNWKAFREMNKVAFTDDVLDGHMYLEPHLLQSGFLQFGEAPIGRMRHLHEELTTLKTSLPKGIFLKVSDARLDVMKVMIRGVKNSPYGGGLFVFDVFLPGGWPMEPPKVLFAMDKKEAGCDMFLERYDVLSPNIHTNGTVCLSLLNTWFGSAQEQWQPNVSTLLSVFVSIQSFILGEPNPYRNNPGREGEGNSQASKAYNKQVQCKTVLYAMLFWLEEESANRSVWKEISAEYWLHKGKKVLDTVKQWSKSNKALRAYEKANNNYHRRGRTGRGADLVARLEKGLESLGKGPGEQGTIKYRY